MKEKLSARGLLTTGGMYKSAVERLKNDGRGALPYKKVVAVGFNALSTSEMVMFQRCAISTGMRDMMPFVISSGIARDRCCRRD